VTEGLGLDGADWEVALDAGDMMAGVSERSRALHRDFVRMFLGGSGAAALAAFALVGMVAQSERTARQRSRFAASAAHELRTPLTGIRVYGEMLADDLGDPASRREYARQVASEADRLSRVVSNVLGYANLERGRVGVRREPGDLAAALRESVAQLRPTVEAHGATLELTVEGELPTFRFDRDAVHQIVANLVDNAERYSRASDGRDLWVTLALRDGHAEIAVRDQGPGIPPRERRRLFRAFQRGPDPDSGGLGLGLAIVASLVRAHDGTVHFEANDPEPGSTFRVRLPA
jgi:signal transduction histidine kinase